MKCEKLHWQKSEHVENDTKSEKVTKIQGKQRKLAKLQKIGINCCNRPISEFSQVISAQEKNIDIPRSTKGRNWKDIKFFSSVQFRKK